MTRSGLWGVRFRVSDVGDLARHNVVSTRRIQVLGVRTEAPGIRILTRET